MSDGGGFRGGENIQSLHQQPQQLGVGGGGGGGGGQPLYPYPPDPQQFFPPAPALPSRGLMGDFPGDKNPSLPSSLPPPSSSFPLPPGAFPFPPFPFPLPPPGFPMPPFAGFPPPFPLNGLPPPNLPSNPNQSLPPPHPHPQLQPHYHEREHEREYEHEYERDRDQRPRGSGDRERHDYDRYDREQDYDRDRDRDQDMDRDKGYERGGDRDWGKGRRNNRGDRERGDREGNYRDRGERDNKHSYRERRHSPPSRHGDRRLLEYDLDANDDEGGRSHGNRGRDEYHSDWERKTPSKIIYIQGLRLETDKETLTDRLKVFGAVEEVRLWKGDTKRGTVQGFAFVEFENLNDANEFMSYHQNQNANNTNNNDEGVVSMELDGAQVTLEYRRDMGPVPGSSGGGGKGGFHRHQQQDFKDWICAQCSGNNFARRTVCFLCQAPRPANPELCTVNSNSEESQAPCPVLVVRNLDFNTTEDVIRASFSKLAQVRDLKLIRDKVSLTSRGFAFIEFTSTEEAQKALRKSMNLKIEDALVRCAYSRKDHLLEHREPRNFNQRERGGGKGQGPLNHQSKFIYNQQTGFYYDPQSGKSYDPASGYYFDSKRYYNFDVERNVYIPIPSSSGSTSSSSSSASSETTSSSTSSSTSAATTSSSTGTSSETPVLPPTSETSKNSTSTVPTISFGNIGFPPVAKTKNLIEIQLVKSTPKASPSSLTGDASNSSVSSAPAQKKKEKKVKHTIFTKKIAGEVQKWNKKTKELSEEPEQETITFVAQNQTKGKPSTINSTSVETPSATPSSSSSSAPSPSATVTTSNKTPVTSTSGTGSDSTGVCLLCKRKFNSAEMLQKHVQQSDLHKHNLEMLKLKQEQFSTANANAPIVSEPEKVPKPVKKSHPSSAAAAAAAAAASSSSTPSSSAPTPASTSTPLDSSNVGMKMLKKFGWKEGEGLGKNGTGITAPIAAEIRSEKAGLGSGGGSGSGSGDVNMSSAAVLAAGVTKQEEVTVMAGDSYQDAVMKKARARFFSLMDDTEEEPTSASLTGTAGDHVKRSRN